MNKKVLWSAGVLVATLSLSAFMANKFTGAKPAELKLPAGFSATIVADSLGPLRHITVTSKGDVYAKLNSTRRGGKGVIFLSDTNHDGRLDKKLAFGNYAGTGVKIKDHYLYSASNSGVFRYKLNDKDEVIAPDQPETIVQGLADHQRDNSKSLALDDQDNLYVTIGSWSDACRQPNSGTGMPGCPILDSAAGIWKFKADKMNQAFSDGVRYATGIKNAVGIDYNPATKTVFATQHGRSFDNMSPAYFTGEKSSELPAETIYELHQGLDAGWPYAYYDQQLKKKMVSPEYGGDGAMSTDKYADPTVAFPGHLAPNDLLFYTGNMFPKRYKNGAFVVFHARASNPVQGYFVAFVPMVNGKLSSNWEIFADNFTGSPDLAHPTGPLKYRPMGLAQGPDGALYVADDLKGAIFKIVYK